MQDKKLYLGIDGGGTRSTAVVADDQGAIVARMSGETINYYAIGMEEAREHLSSILFGLKSQYGLTYYDGVYIGMSALNHEADEELLHRFAAGIIPADCISMHSDAYIALNALTLGEPGMLVISGTGSTAVARSKEGRFIHVGGWGYVLGDQGSAYDIALKGIRASFRSYEGLSAYTTLEDAVKSHFAVEHLPDMVDKVYHPMMPRHVLAEFAVHVSACARDGDQVALQILHEAAQDLALHVDALMDKTRMREATIGVYGSVLMNNPYVYERFKAVVTGKYPDCSVKLPALAPEVGAILCCFEQCGIGITDAVIDNLSQSGYADSIEGGKR